MCQRTDTNKLSLTYAANGGFRCSEKMNLHPTKKESKQGEESLFKKDGDQFPAVKRSLRNSYVDWKVACISLPFAPLCEPR
jgi:hypothetical protein